MVCRSEACFERQKSKTGRNPDTQKQQSLCEKFWRCNQCHSKLNRNKRKSEKHLFGEYNCPNCHQYVTGQHLCYQRYSPPKPINEKLVFFDFEAQQDEIVECSDGYIKPPTCPVNCTVGCNKCNLCTHCKNFWCGKQKHLANFAIAQTVCKISCMDV